LIQVVPPGESLHFQGGEIHLTFSEYLDEASIEKGIELFPRLEEPLSVRYRGKEILLKVPRNLAPDQTYVITLNRQLLDEHGVPLAGSIQLAYSTGGRIDRGSISGRVAGESRAAVHLFRFDTAQTADSLFLTLPDYVTSVNDRGEYRFDYMSPGVYRLVAVAQEAAGLPLEPGRVRYGLPWVDQVTVDTATAVAGLNMLMWQEPPPLRLLRGEWVSATWGRLVFNKNIRDLQQADVVLRSEDGSRHLPRAWYPDPLDPTRLVVESDSLAGPTVQVVIDTFCVGAECLDSVAVTVTLPAEPDTSHLVLLEPGRKITLVPEKGTDPPLDLIFSHPLLPIEEARDFPLLYRDDSVLVETRTDWRNPMWIRVTPFFPWEPNTDYTLNLVRAGFRTRDGRTFRDSLVTIAIHTGHPRGYGGLIVPVTPTPEISLMAELQAVENHPKKFRSVVNSQARFVFKEIPEGSYTLMLFADRDGNQAYSYGRAVPYFPSEWFQVYPDTIEVRANWDIELTPLTLEGLD
jgi:hypothetical protein